MKNNKNLGLFLLISLVITIILVGCNYTKSEETITPDIEYFQTLSNDVLRGYARSYLFEKAQLFGGNDNLKTNEIIVRPNYQKSNKEKGIYFYKVQGQISNFTINNRTISGRFDFSLALSNLKLLSDGEKEGFEINYEETSKINLITDDRLSRELQEVLVKEYLDLNYGNPISSEIVDNISHIYSGRGMVVDTYVTSIMDGYMLHLKLSFKPTDEVIEDQGNNFNITSSHWIRESAEVIIKEDFPENQKIKNDIDNLLFNYFEGRYYEINDKGLTNRTIQFTSGIDNIYNRNLKKASVNKIKLELDLKYNLGLPFRWANYRTNIDLIYEFDMYQEQWLLREDELEVKRFNRL